MNKIQLSEIDPVSRAYTKMLGGNEGHEELLAQLDEDGYQARERLNMCLQAGIAPVRELLVLSTESLRPMLSMLTRWSSRDYQLQRAQELRDSARDQADRFRRERDDARAELARLRDVAEHGRAITELIAQLHRLRRQPERLVGFDWSPPSVVAAVRSELYEVLSEGEGSDAAQRETGDVVSSALQLMLVHGGCPLDQLTQVERRLRERLDLVEKYGMTWPEAKEQLAAFELMTAAEIEAWHDEAAK